MGGSGGGTGSGYQVGTTCFPACASDASDPDDMGVRDGYGYENGRSCVVPDSAPTTGAARCEPPPVTMPDAGIPPGDGFYVGGMCFPRCASDGDAQVGFRFREMQDLGRVRKHGRAGLARVKPPLITAPMCATTSASTRRDRETSSVSW